MPFRHPGSTARPDVLVAAGLDPSGGAGLIADTRVLHELGARPVGVVTALTVQNTTGVVEWHACDPEVVGHQLAFLMTDIEVKAVKLGLIGSSGVARAIASALHLTNAPVVWDPVAAPSLGHASFGELDEAMASLRPHLALVTPNVQELALLSHMPIDSTADAEAAARHLAHQLDCAVLVKSGHMVGPDATDILISVTMREELHGPRIANGEHVHGTGCALSSAIAAYLAAGRSLPDACREAKAYVAERIANPVTPGRGAPAVI